MAVILLKVTPCPLPVLASAEVLRGCSGGQMAVVSSSVVKSYFRPIKLEFLFFLSLFLLLFFLFLFLAMLHGMQDLSFLTRKQTHAPCSGPPGNSPN